MKLAYMLLIHKNPNQVNRLINALSDEDVVFFVHIDKSSQIEEQIIKNQNVLIVPERVNVQWGGYSQIKATLCLIEFALKHAEKFDYYILLSGQDYPIKSRSEIKKYLSDHRGKQFFKAHKMPFKYWQMQKGGFDRIEIYYPQFMVGSTRTQYRMRKHYLKLVNRWNLRRKRAIFDHYYGISNWFAATRDCMEYIYKFSEDNSKGLKFFQYSLMADEVYFNSIVMNSPFKSQVVQNDLRLVDWTTGPEIPLIWKESHMEQLRNAEELFARKFDIEVDREVLDLLDQQIG